MIGSNKAKEKPTDEKESSQASENTTDPGKDGDVNRYRYENDKYVYTDPTCGAEYEWDEVNKVWSKKEDSGAPEGSPSHPHNHHYQFDGQTYVYTDKHSGTKYKWSQTKHEWVNADGLKKESDDEEEEEFEDGEGKKEIKRQDMSQGVYGFDGESHTYTDAKDGTVYIWDTKKSAWFPKIDEDFLAQYQMSYGFNNPSPPAEAAPQTVQTKEEPKETEKNTPLASETQKDKETEKRKKDPTWFDVDEKTNTKVYVSNLPIDLTEIEFVELMQKCGLVMKDPDTGKMKVKLYTDPTDNSFKGDALCTYIKVESVELALKILDGYDVRGKKMQVERAKFTMKGDAYDPTLKPKKKRKKDLQKIKQIQQKLFDWRPEKLRGEREKYERVVIVKNLFEPAIFESDVGLILEYQQDLRDECSKCGNVKKVTVFDRHPEGVAQIIFKEAEAADACVQLLNNRWFGQRQITAATWDGKTKYKIEETEEEKAKRLKKWEKFIQEEEEQAKAKEKEARDEGKKEVDRDSDQDTRSSAGSDDSTDDEATNNTTDKTSKQQ